MTAYSCFLPKVMTSYSSSIIKRIVTKQTFEQLCSLWSATAKMVGQEALLVTEKHLLTSSKVTEIHSEKNVLQEQFRLLIMPQFKVLLTGIISQADTDYQVSIIFDSETIATQLSQLNQHDRAEIENFQQTILPSLQQDRNNLSQFVAQLLHILTTDNLATDIPAANDYPHFCYDQSMEKILHHQLEQKRILERVKIQIGQHLDLLEIIQMTIEQVLRLLELDRLVIYQLDVPLESIESDPVSVQKVDTVTYEARASDEIASILYFHDEICFTQTSQCKDKYRQGFSLIVNNVETNPNLTPCLQDLMGRLEIKAKLVTPIIVRGKLWGFIIAHQCFAPRDWQQSEIRFLHQIADYLAIAIYQNQSYQQLQIQKKLLEKQVKTRAKQLKDALIAAQVANQSKHEFIGNMSHELRTPLTCIIGLSGTLLHWSSANGKVPLSIEKQQQYLKTIQDSGKQLLALINSILELSDVEAGKYLLDITEFSLHQLANAVLQTVREEAQKQQVDLILEFQIQPEKDLFRADREKLQEILLNLVSNGIKFTSEGGRVTLRIWREQQQAIFEVEDTGIGIAQQQLPFLFEKFKQLEHFRQRTYSGAGLGLALTKQLVELHGGGIQVESALGKGSTFTVYLPEREILKPDSPEEVAISEITKTKVRNIVLLAQDEKIATFICQMLTAADYQVIWLLDTSTAIAQIHLLEPDLVILDREFLDVDIDFLSKNLKKMASEKQLKLILLSEQLTDNERQYFSEQGIDDYLLKVMQPTYLLEKINSLIK
jgi:two-component system sensor histidine kinase/response regulator